MHNEKTLIKKILQERVKFYHNDRQEKSVYDVKPTSFYDGPKYVDERAIKSLPLSDPKRQKYEKEQEQKRIHEFVTNPQLNDWDD